MKDGHAGTALRPQRVKLQGSGDVTSLGSVSFYRLWCWDCINRYAAR